MWLTRILASVAFLFSIIVSIPLAFDVGGRACGLAFSLSLSSFYFFYSTLRLATPDRSRFRWAFVQLLGATQWIILPSLLIWALNRFSVDPVNNTPWVERTFSGKRAGDASIGQWISGPDGLLETVTVGGWDKLLIWATPVFQLCEGFCSLLVIQAAGQITRWLVNRGGRRDTWMVRCSSCAWQVELETDSHLDRPACDVGHDHLKLYLLPLADRSLPRHRQC